MADVKVAHNLATKPRTVDVSIDESVDFASLHLSDSVLQGLKSSGFHRPSPIQLKAIPLGRCGLDLIVQAKSGTGKTCVFSVVALECVNVESNSVQAIVVAPTREIAVQIWEVINLLGSGIEALRCYTFIGGMPLEADKKKLKRCHIAVGTPGRLKQLLEEGLMWPDSVRLFVLDEADKLLEDSFQDTINWIYSCLPENKQMLALSATYPEALAQHLTAYMRAPTFVRLNASDPALLGIRQYYKKVAFHPMSPKAFEAKVQETLKLLSAISFNQCLVFSNYQTRAESLSKQLSKRGWPSVHISGQQEQQQRLTAMAKLRQYKCRVLVTTDLTSRGIDAENVNLVIHLDIPRDHETYLHRVGRAGRFGTYGASIVITAEGKELGQLCDIQDKCNTDIIAVPVPIPSDLAKSSGYPNIPIVNLDHLVSTEQLTPSNPLPSESDSAMEARGHIEGRLTREGACAPNSQGQEKVDGKTGCTEGVKEERIKEEVVEEMNKNEEKTEDNSNQEQEEETLPKDSKDEALYIPPQPQKLQFQYPERTERKPISLTEISDFVTNAKDVDRPVDCLSISTCPSNIETLTEQIADVLDSVHLGKKQAICRMAGEKEVEGLLEAEMLGTRKSVEKTENQKDQKARKKGRLVKQDLTLGQDYFLKLAPKDDFPETETEDSDSSESETESESGTTSYQESDFTNVKNRQKASGRRRTNSYRRLLSKGERNKQSEGNLYADDEGSETPGVGGVGEVGGESYPKLQWTPVEKSTKQEVVNLPIREHYNDQYDGESRRLGDEGEDTEEEESDGSSDSSSYSDEEDEDDQIQSQQIPPSNAYNQYYPYPPSAYHLHTRPQASGTVYPFHPSHPYSQYYNQPPFPPHPTSTRSQSNAGDASSRSHAKNPRSTAPATMPYPGMGADSYFGMDPNFSTNPNFGAGADSYFGMDPNFGTGSNPGTNPNFGTGADSYFRMDPNFSTNPNFGAGAGAESYYGTDAYSVPRYPDPYLQNSSTTTTTTSAAAVDPEPVPPPPWSGAYEQHVYARYRHHRHRADYYAALYRHAVNTRMMEDVYRRQEGYIKSMAKAASGQERR